MLILLQPQFVVGAVAAASITHSHGCANRQGAFWDRLSCSSCMPFCLLSLQLAAAVQSFHRSMRVFNSVEQ